jgi:transmembrane sensor
MAFVTEIPAEIRAEAAAWLARLRADDKNAVDEAAFRSWLAKDPRHARAFESVTELWEAAGAAWDAPVVQEPRFVFPRRALLASVGSLAAAGVVMTVWQGAEAGVFETGVGEQKHAVLPDGTQVFLDTDSRIAARFDGQTRLVALDRGRCNFHVRDSDSRPFVVDAARHEIVAAHATFDVRRDDEAVCVVLVQGSATIAPQGSGPRQSLQKGDRALAGPHGITKDRPNLVPLLAWQTGQAVFDNETVAEAIREMNRYSVVKIAADDTDVEKMRISGVYHVGDNVAFAHSVAALLPVILEVDSNQVRLALDHARAKRT